MGAFSAVADAAHSCSCLLLLAACCLLLLAASCCLLLLLLAASCCLLLAAACCFLLLAAAAAACCLLRSMGGLRSKGEKVMMERERVTHPSSKHTQKNDGCDM